MNQYSENTWNKRTQQSKYVGVHVRYVTIAGIEGGQAWLVAAQAAKAGLSYSRAGPRRELISIGGREDMLQSFLMWMAGEWPQAELVLDAE